MDFHSLTRRELQTLCKMNKIQANMTNIAMADSLKALEIVEGIEEFLQKCESEITESSIESPERSELTSPYVPPIGGRSTRHRNAPKEEPETVKSYTRNQRTTRRTLTRYADESQAEAIKTPAPQTNRKKGQITSTRRNMDSQLKECVDEETKDVLVTPAPSGVTSRRRRVAKEESAVKQVYSTRRSVRLAKKNAGLLNEAGNENADASKKDMFTNDCRELKMTLKESPDDLDETSAITGVVDADSTVEENSEKKDEWEVISAEKQNMSIVNEAEMVLTIEEQNTDKDAGCEDKAANSGENDNFAVSEVSGDAGIHIEVEKDESDGKDLGYEDVTDLNVNEEVLKNNDSCEKKRNPDESDSDILEAAEKLTLADMHFDISLMNEEDEALKCNAANALSGGENDPIEEESEPNLVKDTDLELQQSPAEELNNVAVKEEPGEIDIIQPEETEKVTDKVPSEEASDYLTNAPYCGEAVKEQLPGIKNSPSKQLEGVICGDLNADFPDHLPTSDMDDEAGHQIPLSFPEFDSSLVQPTCLTPITQSASKASAKKKMTAVSDNKENIGSGIKLVLTKERVKTAKNTGENVHKLENVSMRKLKKMLKGKLQITNKPSKNDNENEILTSAKPALQVLPENRKSD